MTRHTVVVADDDARIVDTISQLLESAGHTVVGKAYTGEEAVWLNQTLIPDVVLLDLEMPGLGGLGAAKRMMETRRVAIVICTAYCDDQLMAEASKAGVYAYVVKPCRLLNLLPAMNVAVSRFQEAGLLRSEVVSLRDALADRRWVEQAKGIVMETRRIPETAAHRFLQRESQRQSRSMAELSKAIVLARQTLTPAVHGASADGAVSL